ncbi:nitrous oxide-stimulated promoter family protein [Geobacter sp. DSM 9736]|uniref:nitrous oxide-stimulated promoter family protein n=1 Tax=Geobacter sp. DSM 9736 TaxID=1277350 RepID=UPI000B50084D|nr:nitrous oxide-stimulated promoter family protein [Geobacter sp. DSM 9736]SNB47839.1 Nitrous oxide-stimulated promoter [Geobacter sp. DSM 9736]
MDQLTDQQINDQKVLFDFIRVYCRAKHASVEAAEVEIPEKMRRFYRKGLSLCPDCAALAAYALEKRRKCPLDPKPSCKHCRIHCYSREYRSRIREIMAFSGRRMILRGRLDYLWHYFF